MKKNKFIGCYLDDEEYLAVQRNVTKYGYKSTSEYLRAALDFFDVRRYNASKYNEVSIIQDCITLLSDHKKSVESTMLQKSFKELGENLKGQNDESEETFKESDENLKGNLKESEDKTFKKTDENLKGLKIDENKTQLEPFENVIQTLIRITHVKGRPSDDDFTYQAKRCGKSKKEITDYYDDNYDFFTKESDKYL